MFSFSVRKCSLNSKAFQELESHHSGTCVLTEDCTSLDCRTVYDHTDFHGMTVNTPRMLSSAGIRYQLHISNITCATGALAALGKAPNFYLKQKPFLFCFSGVKISVLLMYSYSNIRKKQERKLVTLSGNPSKSRAYDFAEVKQNLQLSRFGSRTVV